MNLPSRSVSILCIIQMYLALYIAVHILYILHTLYIAVRTYKLFVTNTDKEILILPSTSNKNDHNKILKPTSKSLILSCIRAASY